jgi:hypothetical protein
MPKLPGELVEHVLDGRRRSKNFSQIAHSLSRLDQSLDVNARVLTHKYSASSGHKPKS